MELGIFTEFNVREGVTQSEAFDESYFPGGAGGQAGHKLGVAVCVPF